MLSVTLSPLRASFSFQNATSAWSSREGTLLQVQDQSGLIGLGEASPLPDYSRETLAETIQCLHAISRALSPIDVVDLKLIEALSREGDLTSSARFAVESALLDLLGQQRQRTIAALLCDAPRAELPLNALLTLKEERETITEAQRLASMGYQTIKIKLRAGQSERDFALIEALHRALPEVRLRLDANGSWGIDEALSWLSRYESIASLIEQPVAVGLLSTLGRLPTPWAADESLQDPAEAAAVLKRGAAEALVLKPAALGGLLRCLPLARHSKSFVTHLFDGPVAMAAACELARALPGELLDCGLDAHDGLSLLPAVQAPHPLRRAQREAPMGFGLGFSREEREAITTYVSRQRP